MLMSDVNIDATGSAYTKLSEGCRLCLQGAKMVLFVTGACGRDCFYCPLSEERKGKDDTYANERKVASDEDVIAEAKRMSALGTGITGGEPLLVFERTLHYITLLKLTFGKEHHIHLYTGIAPSGEMLLQLKNAGLDEIRFHPPIVDWDHFMETPFVTAMKKAKALGMDAGVEIPAIKNVPGIVHAVKEINGFLNLNELEFSETNFKALEERGYRLRDDVSNAAEGSEGVAHEIALNILANTRYCSSRFKDAVQLRERLKRIARNVARPFDEVSDDGTIIYGEIIGNMAKARQVLEQMKVPRRMYALHDDRIDIAWWILDDISLHIEGDKSIVERYPMENGLIVERIPL
jgi:pyruvate formate-lyase activating enzyme-like uncharacterized protein